MKADFSQPLSPLQWVHFASFQHRVTTSFRLAAFHWRYARVIPHPLLHGLLESSGWIGSRLAFLQAAYAHNSARRSRQRQAGSPRHSKVYLPPADYLTFSWAMASGHESCGASGDQALHRQLSRIVRPLFALHLFFAGTGKFTLVQLRLSPAKG